MFGVHARMSSQTSLALFQSKPFRPIFFAIIAMISQSYFASPGPSTAFRTRLTRRSPLVNVPSFSAKHVPGRTTSAYSQLSFQKMSCMTQKSSFSSCLMTWFESGYETTGFSPMKYIALIGFPASLICSVSVEPYQLGRDPSFRPHAFSIFALFSGTRQDWYPE